MGQDKKQLEHLLSFVSAVYNDPDNKEFADGIQDMIKKDLQGDKSSWSGKIDQIYEYCLSKNLREQAKDFYKNFPLTSIKQTLIERYIEMEEARRKDNFDSFGRCLFLQIESIVKAIFQDSAFVDTFRAMYDSPSTLDTSDWSNLSVDKRYSKSKPIHEILFRDDSNRTRETKNIFISDKICIVLYFICYKAMLVFNDISRFNEDKFLLYDISIVRNHESHEGGEITKYQKNRYEEISRNVGQSYLKFSYALLLFVKGIETGYPMDSHLVEYAKTLK